MPETDERMRMPEYRSGQWFNSEPLTIAALRGKVVITDFWDYTCVNCLHTLPYMRAWHERYADKGLVIVGVHAPEFPFAAAPQNVLRALGELGISYPVLLDNDYATWRAYNNRYWPAKYIGDQDGYLRYFHFGEGSYGETEALIQKLLREIDPSVELPEIMAPLRAEDKVGAVCYRVTPELYLGNQRGKPGNREGYREEQVVNYAGWAGQRSPGVIYLAGSWRNLAEAVEYAGTSEQGEGDIEVDYTAAEVNLVLHPSEQSNDKLYLTLDNRPLPPRHYGADVQPPAGDDDRPYIVISEPRMYRLVNSASVEDHRLGLHTAAPGLRAYAFTFVSRCK
jgi:thiol-disulfide isomerase/thioredoxin